MLAVYLQPDSLKIVQGRLGKDNVLEIKDYRNLSNAVIGKNYFNILIAASSAGKDKNSVDNFADLFREIKKISGYKRENVYLVLPDFLFYRIDCFSYDKEADMEEQIRSLLGVELDEVYYSVPILTNPAPKENRAIVYSIERKYIDVIIEAEKLANVRLNSVEASSISFLRASGQFQKEEFIFQCYEKDATMIAYSSLGGLFTVNMPELSIENLGYLSDDDANDLVESSIAWRESTAKRKFKNINNDIPITILSNSAIVGGFNAFKEREGVKQKFAKCIVSDIPPNEQQEWMPVVGTLMQYECSDSVVIDDYEKILSGNLLPNKIQKNSKLNLLFAKIKNNRYLRESVLFAVLLLVSLICSFALYTIKESSEPKREYRDIEENYEDIFSRHKPEDDSFSIKKQEKKIKSDKPQINTNTMEKTTDISVTPNPTNVENDANKNIVEETAVTLPKVPAIRIRSVNSVPVNIPLPAIPQNQTPPKETPNIQNETKNINEEQVSTNEDTKNITMISDDKTANDGGIYGDGRIAFIGGDGIEFR